MQIEPFDADDYASLVADGIPLKEMREGVKVWRLPDGRIVKLFRPRGRWSRTRLFPANVRFARNAEKLGRLGFATVAVQQLFMVRDNGLWGLIYPELPGSTLEQAIAATPQPQLIAELGQLLLALHQQGVLFRSLHLGNIVRLGSGGLALIDVEEVKFSRRPLNQFARYRNFRHLLRRQEDRRLLTREGFTALVDVYLNGGDFSSSARQQLSAQLTALAGELDWP